MPQSECEWKILLPKPIFMLGGSFSIWLKLNGEYGSKGKRWLWNLCYVAGMHGIFLPLRRETESVAPIWGQCLWKCSNVISNLRSFFIQPAYNVRGWMVSLRENKLERKKLEQCRSFFRQKYIEPCIKHDLVKATPSENQVNKNVFWKRSKVKKSDGRDFLQNQ